MLSCLDCSKSDFSKYIQKLHLSKTQSIVYLIEEKYYGAMY